MDPHDTTRQSLFARLGHLMVRRRYWVIAVWMLAMVAALAPLSALNGRLSQGGFEVPGSQSDKVKRAVASGFPRQFNQQDLLVLHSSSITADDAVFRAVVGRAVRALRDGPGVGAVTDPYLPGRRAISPDGHTVTVVVGLTDDQDQALNHANALGDLGARAAAGSPVDVYLTGPPPFYKALQETATADLEKAERIALPISLVILVLAFGSLIAAGVPLILALLGLGVSFGILSLVAAHTTVSIFTQNVASMIGLGVGIDYSLFILSRYRARLAEGRSVEDAVADAIASSGKAVFVSGLTVVVALSGTLLVNLAALRSMGFGSMIAVAIAATSALTLLPALLGVIGTRINSLRVRRTGKSENAFWRRWALGVMRRPWTALIGCTVVIAALAVPATNLRLGSSGPSILAAGAPARVGTELVTKAFGAGQTAPIIVLVSDPSGVADHGLAGVHRLAQAIANEPLVRRVDSIATLVPGGSVKQQRAALQSQQGRAAAAAMVSGRGNRTIALVVTRGGPQADDTVGFIDKLRREIPGLLPAGMNAVVGGEPGLETDINHEISNKLPYVVGLVLLLSYLILMLFLRSVFLPLKAIILNLGSVLAAYGVLVLVFQEGHGAGLLGSSAQGHIDSFNPILMFCVLFGLSMDYEIFLLARIREEYSRSQDNTHAVAWGLEKTAGIITSAAAIMVTVFAGFALTTLVPVQEVGFGLAVAVLLDATLIRVVLVPAAMRLMGQWNWWLPAWLDNLLPHISLDAPSAPDMRERAGEPAGSRS